MHRPLSDLVSAVVAAGLVIDAIVELGEPTPDVLAIGARIAAPSPAVTY